MKKAVINHWPGEGLLVHSDRGIQYASADFKQLLKSNGFIQIMNRKENSWDNAVAECFFHTIKTQLIYHCKFGTIEEDGENIFQYIEIYIIVKGGIQRTIFYLRLIVKLNGGNKGTWLN